MLHNQHQYAICHCHHILYHHSSVFYHSRLTFIGLDPIMYIRSLVLWILGPQDMHTQSPTSGSNRPNITSAPYRLNRRSNAIDMPTRNRIIPYQKMDWRNLSCALDIVYLNRWTAKDIVRGLFRDGNRSPKLRHTIMYDQTIPRSRANHIA